MSARVPLSPMVYLTIRHGKRAGQTFSAPGPTVTIGRVSDNSVVIDDPQVSRHHASITFEGGQWVLRDLGSTNGTTLNGQPVTAPVVIHEGDVIGLGEVMVSVQLMGVAGSEETAVEMRAPAAKPVSARAQPVAKGGDRSWVLPVVIFVLLVAALAVTAVLAFLLLRGPAAPPQVVITAPLNGTVVGPGKEVEVQVVAQDARGVTRIDLWVDNTLYASQSSPDARGQASFAVVHRWTPSAPGSHALLAKAYNVNGQETLSPIVFVTVMQPTSEVSQLPTPQATEQAPSPVPTDTPLPSLPTNTPLPPATPTPLPPPTPTTCMDDAVFVADVTVPDGTVVAPGQRIDKVWRLRNIGSCTWGPGYTAVFVSGSQMSAPPAVSIPNTPPGAVVDIGVTLYAPAAPGSYVSYWQLRNAAGVLFGRRFLVQVVVPAPATPTPIPSPTPETYISFVADRTEVSPGECVTLRWDVENVAAVYLNDSGVVGHGSQSVCPTTTTTYVLRVQLRDGGTTERSITITVNLPEVPKPTQIGPPDGSVFDYYPRVADFYWSEVSYPGDVTYTIEIQYGTPDGTDWKPWQKVEGLTETHYRMDSFIGAYNKGRWRVWAVSNITGQRSEKTDWWKFHFTM
ncbi:MAG: NBR1-Ig-like domain-containing protein [Anaerolineae bacterium]